MGKTEDHTDRCKDILCPWTGRVNTIKNDHTTQGNLQIQCNPYQITNGSFYTTGTKNFKICMETQKTEQSKKS